MRYLDLLTIYIYIYIYIYNVLYWPIVPILSSITLKLQYLLLNTIIMHVIRIQLHTLGYNIHTNPYID